MQDDAVARAWELKALCYAAWHSEPQRTRAAADALAALAAQQTDAPLQALACWTDGIALLAEGRLAEGLHRLEQAQAAFVALGDAQHAAEATVPQMVALSFLGREAEVVERGRMALDTFVAAGDERSAGKVEINLGTSLTRQDRHAEAEGMYRSAASRFASLGDAELSLMADIGTANTLTWQFRLDEALGVCALARRRAQDSGYAILHAQTLEATGRIELNRGRWREALSALAEALRILEAAGASPQRRLECETALADAYAAVSLLGEALRLYGRIIDAADALEAPNEAAWATLQHARVLGRSGQYDAALAGFARAREHYVALDNLPSIALTDLCRARVLLALGRSGEAQHSAALAAESLQRSGIRGWWLEARTIEAAALARSGQPAQARTTYDDTLALAGNLPHVAFECHAGLGAMFFEQGDLAAARRELERSLRRLDAEREALPADDLRSALGAEAAQVHETLIGVARAEADARRLFVDIDRGRARALAQGVAGADADPHDSSPPPEAPARLRWLRSAWREAIAENDGTQMQALGDEIRAAEEALLEEHRRADLRGDTGTRRSALAEGQDALDLDALQQALGPGRALLAYHLHGGQVLAVVATDRDVSVHAVASAGITERVAGLRLQIEAMRNPLTAQRHGALLVQRLRAHAQLLHERLWAPVERACGDREEIVIVPHGALHDLPFALLDDGSCWLVDRKVLSVAPSAAVWLTLARRQAVAPRRRVLALGARGSGLIHVGREIDAVASVFGADAITLRDDEATATRLRAAAAESPLDILHLACHARFRGDNPAFSNLMLSDGPLPMHELARWKLSAQLVVLSACETGVSRIAPGEEAFGLVRAVMLAGARSVVATQWAVDDEATANLIEHFYGSLRAGASAGRALQHAQREAARQGLHPYLWGALTLHGPG